MRAMPKTLDTQGFSGLREEVVRSEGSPSRTPVLQEIICYLSEHSKTQKPQWFLGFLFAATSLFGANLVQAILQLF